jgi:hypothetical protein
MYHGRVDLPSLVTEWLPRLMSQSAVLWDIVGITLARMVRGQSRTAALASSLHES